MKLRFVTLFAPLAVLVGASVGGSDRAEAQFGGSPLPGFPPGVFDNRAALAGPSGGGYQGPGDIVGSATAFYSCARAYNAAYATATGNLCIIADVGTGLTTCTLVAATTGFVNLTGTYCGGSTPAAFCTAHTSCVVTQMYDQSGALACASSTACNLSQATLADMPALTFSALNSLPCLTSAANQSMTSTNPLTISQPWTFTAVAERTGSFTTENDLIGNNGGGVNSFFTPATGHVELYILGGSTTVVAADSAFHGLQFIAGSN
jgi:hypothetical protein